MEVSKSTINISPLAGWVHVIALVSAFATSLFAGFGGMLAAFIVWVLQEDKKGLVAKNAAEAFNINFSLFVYVIISIVFCVLTLGLGFLLAAPFWVGLAIWWLIASVVAAKKGFEGQVAHSGFIIRLL